jgi:hypothetical protein
MTERTRALKILQKAQALLAERLTQQILDDADEILSDASGDSYMNEIETIYEQIGVKLAHVTAMLSNLPAERPAPHTETVAAHHTPENTFTVATEASPSADAVVEQTTPALAGPLFVATPALPAPKRSEQVKDRPTNAALQAFAAQIQAGDLLAAGRTLAALFELDEQRAVACAATFSQRVRHEAAFFRKVMELRSELFSSNPQRALVLLLDCFHLTRGESAQILRNLQRRRRPTYG